MMSTNFDFEIEQLNFSFQHEVSMKNNLEKKNEEVEKHIACFEQQLANVSNDPNDCEWGRKYLTQTEINAELLKQIKLMEEKMNQLEDIEPNGSDADNNSKLNDTDLRNMLRQLEKEKHVLVGNLKDVEWRLDSESQELFRLNEDKEKYRLELNKATLESKKAIKRSVSPNPGLKFSKSFNGISMKNKHGIPDNHRILDPRKGPIKKTAAVKTLPKLSQSAPLSADSGKDKKHKSKTKKSLETGKTGDREEGRSGALTS
jgi:hypothetical protein